MRNNFPGGKAATPTMFLGPPPTHKKAAKSPNICIHHRPSLCRKGWVKMGWTSVFWLMSSDENNKLLQTCILDMQMQMHMIGLGKYKSCLERNPAMLQKNRWYHLSANADGWVWQMQNDQTSKSRYMQQHFMAMINKLYAWSILIIAMQRLLIMTRYKIYHAFLFHRILKILTAWRMLQISAPKKEISSFPTIYIMGEGGICLKWVELNILSKK